MGLLLWGVFGSGLLVQALAPRMRIENRTFILSPSLVSEASELNPAEIVQKERRMQLLSAALTLGGALGLAFHYRRVLIGSRSPQLNSTESSTIRYVSDTRGNSRPRSGKTNSQKEDETWSPR